MRGTLRYCTPPLTYQLLSCIDLTPTCQEPLAQQQPHHNRVRGVVQFSNCSVYLPLVDAVSLRKAAAEEPRVAGKRRRGGKIIYINQIILTFLEGDTPIVSSL